MRAFPIIYLLFCFQALAQTPPAKVNFQESKDQYINGVYIPKDLDDALVQFEKNWSDSMKKAYAGIPEDLVLRRYYGLHDWLMDNWGLWLNSRLAQYFHRFGLYHPEDMAAIIMIAFYRQTNEKDIMLKDLIEHYRDYWKLKERSRPDITPEKIGEQYQEPIKKVELE